MPDDVSDAPAFTPPASQDELDRIIGQRLAKERAKFGDYDEVKQKAAKYDEVAQSSKSEQQQLRDEIAERDARIAALPSEIRRQAIGFASAATRAGFLDPEDALLNLSDVDLNDSDAVRVALAELAERKPHLVRAPDEPKRKLPTKPKPAKGDETSSELDDLNRSGGKERAAAALRQLRHTGP